MQCRENRPAAISGMVEPGRRLIIVDDMDVKHLNAEQVLEILKPKQHVKLCLKTESAAHAFCLVESCVIQ